MKKFFALLVFLVTGLVYSQVPTDEPVKFPDGIQLPNASEDNVSGNVPVMDDDGIITGFVTKENLVPNIYLKNDTTPLTDVNVPLGDGYYVVSNNASNFPFTHGTMLVKMDNGQRVDLAIGRVNTGDYKLAVRRWDGGEVRPWSIIPNEAWVNGQGFLTVEEDPTVPQIVKQITANEISNWNEAYSWGNHADAGYVPETRTLTAGNGINQIGDLSQNRNISLDFNYLDDRYTTGFKQHEAVRVATNGNITLSSLQMIDGVSLSSGDRVLVKMQTNAADNGIYVASSGGWTRATDFDTAGQGNVEQGASVFVEEGSLLAKTGWTLSTGGTITVGTTPLEFIQYSGATNYAGGNNITIVGNEINHDQGSWVNKTALTRGDVISNLNVDDYGHVTDWSTRNLDGRYELQSNKAVDFDTKDNTLYPTTSAVNNNFMSTQPDSNNPSNASFSGDLDTIKGINSFWYQGAALNRPGYVSAGGMVLNLFSTAGSNAGVQIASGWGSEELGYRIWTTGGGVTPWVQFATREWVGDQGFLTSFSEQNNLTQSVTWANVPDANITESSVKQYEGDLSIDWSQITGSPSFDDYGFWNLKIDGVQSQQITSQSDVNFAAGDNVSIDYSAGGNVTISSENTQYSAGQGINLTGTTFNVGAGVGLTQQDNGLRISEATMDDISEGVTAYSWGNHADAGYLTTETDPLFNSSAASGITGSDITSWNNKAEIGDIPTNNNQLTNGAGYPVDGEYFERNVGNDFNGLITSGVEDQFFTRLVSGAENAPTSAGGYWNTFTFFGSATGAQLTMNNGTDRIWSRSILNSTTYGSWRQLAFVDDLFSGNYNDLTNKPTIPTDNLQLTNGQGYIKNADLNGYATEQWVEDQNYLTTETDPIFNAQKGQANGVATLNGSGKVPLTQLPNSILILQGSWNANTNTPTLSDGTGTPGYIYETTVPGTTDFGSGAITFKQGDYAIYGADGKWYKSINSNDVQSVNGQSGIVTLNTDDINEGNNLYFTDQRAINAVSSVGYAMDDEVIHKTGNETKSGALVIESDGNSLFIDSDSGHSGIGFTNSQGSSYLQQSFNGSLMYGSDPLPSNNALVWTDENLTNNNQLTNGSGYLTTETDPTVPEPVKQISSTNINNWNTAFGWGNHANAGYELQSNKAVDFDTKDNTLYPTTSAVNNNFMSTQPDSNNPSNASFSGDLDTIKGINSFWYQGAALNRPGYVSAGGMVLNLFSTAGSNAGVQIASGWGSEELGYRIWTTGGGVTPWVQFATREWVGDQNFANTSQLFSGNYNDLTNKPTIPNVYDNEIEIFAGTGLTGGGVFTLNQNEDELIHLAANFGTTAGTVMEGNDPRIGTATWGNITGTLSNQTDLQTELDKKVEKITHGPGIVIDDSNPKTPNIELNNIDMTIIDVQQGSSAVQLLDRAHNNVFIFNSGSTCPGASVMPSISLPVEPLDGYTVTIKNSQSCNPTLNNIYYTGYAAGDWVQVPTGSPISVNLTLTYSSGGVTNPSGWYKMN